MDADQAASPQVPEPLGHRRRLGRQQIVDAAIELLDEVGLEQLSTRKLADRLGIRSPSLYWHVRDKNELMDLVAEHLCADAFEIDSTAPWRTQIEQGMRQFRAQVVAHRDLATLLRERPATGPNRLGHIETTLRILLEAGISTEDAAGISRLLVAHVLSTAPRIDPIRESGADAVDSLTDYPNLRQVAPVFARLSADEMFDLGVDLILDGIDRRRTQQRGPRAENRWRY